MCGSEGEEQRMLSFSIMSRCNLVGHIPKRARDFSAARAPVHFFKISENLMGRFWEVNLERASQLDNDWKVVGADDRKGALVDILMMIVQEHFQ